MTLALIGVVLMLGCGSDSTPAPSPSPTPNPPPTQPPPAAGTISIVNGASSLGDRAYNPNPITITAGSTVTWTNNDTVTHTSTGNGGGFDSGSIAPGDTFRFTFPSAGTFQYHCSIHPGMVASVVVQ
jgi:plastocyanin